MLGILGTCTAQTLDVLCRDGNGHFETEFHGVRIHVGAAKNGKLATRECEATLGSDKKELTVATESSEVDLDALGVNLGVDVPVVAFQVKKSAADCCRTYQIYSLQKPSRLLRTITGGDFFSAADTDLDDRVEIWTDDAAATNGFEGLILGELDFAPPIVLRFQHERLLDVSAEFQPYYDRLIANLRTQLNSEDLHGFKNSDGKLRPAGSLSAERLHLLRRVKIKILEVVWAYLYSGRERAAWESLAEMWPTVDLDRIRAAILSARAHGVQAQVDGVSSQAPSGRKKRAMIFNAITKSEPSQSEVVPPEPILLQRAAPAASEQGLTDSELLVDLLIDSAGKVRSIEPAGNKKLADPGVINAAMEWKFIPAFNGGRPVASRLRLAVSVRR